MAHVERSDEIEKFHEWLPLFLLKVSPPLIILKLVLACRFALEHACMHGSCAKARLPHLGEINRMGETVFY